MCHHKDPSSLAVRHPRCQVGQRRKSRPTQSNRLPLYLAEPSTAAPSANHLRRESNLGVALPLARAKNRQRCHRRKSGHLVETTPLLAETAEAAVVEMMAVGMTEGVIPLPALTLMVMVMRMRTLPLHTKGLRRRPGTALRTPTTTRDQNGIVTDPRKRTR